MVVFPTSDPLALARTFEEAGHGRASMVAVDGVFSMTGAVAPLADLNEVALDHDAFLYVDDAHGTGTLGSRGRGTVLDALGSYDNTIVVGSLSKAFSCFGGFVGCTAEIKELLKMKSSTFIFGGPVPPPYLEAILAAIEILDSDEYEVIYSRLAANVARIVAGMRRLGLAVLGGTQPILSVLVGDEGDTLAAGKFLFDRGYYVQSVVFPAVPYHAGVLRIQANANHTDEAIDGLIASLDTLRNHVPMPGPEALHATPPEPTRERATHHVREVAVGIPDVLRRRRPGVRRSPDLARDEAGPSPPSRPAGSPGPGWP